MVFDAIAGRLKSLTGVTATALAIVEEGALRNASTTVETTPANASLIMSWRQSRIPLDREWMAGRAVLERRTIYEPDILNAEPGDRLPPERNIFGQFGLQSILIVPLLRGETGIGVLALAAEDAHAITPQHIALAEVFADQAVIAIENARLFNELQERNREAWRRRSTNKRPWPRCWR